MVGHEAGMKKQISCPRLSFPFALPLIDGNEITPAPHAARDLHKVQIEIEISLDDILSELRKWMRLVVLAQMHCPYLFFETLSRRSCQTPCLYYIEDAFNWCIANLLETSLDTSHPQETNPKPTHTIIAAFT